jgi:Baseplate J-like protein.
MAAAKLTDVFSVWPDRDGYLDHSTALAGKRAFTLFRNSDRVVHMLYLAHAVLLDVKSNSVVEVSFDLSSGAGSPLAILWELWDGQVWRPFGDPVQDGSAGLQRSGTVKLKALCADSIPTKVANIRSSWIRATLEKPLPPVPGATLATAQAISVRTTIERPLKSAGGGWSGLDPDAGWADSSKLNFSKTFYPFGKNPTQETAFYFQSEEILVKPGAVVQMAITLSTTPEQEADSLGAQYQVDVNSARAKLIDAAKQAGQAAVDAADGVILFVVSGSPISLVTFRNAVSSALAGLNDPQKIKDIPALLQDLAGAATLVMVDMVFDWFPPPIGSVPDVPATQARIQTARAAMVNVIKTSQAALASLGQLGPVTAAAGGGSAPPKLAPPRLIWEYFDGTGWRPLIPPAASGTNNLLASGVLTFTVPADLEPYEIEGQMVRVVRARLASGSYNDLQMISWFDDKAGQTNYIPVVKPHPPALSGFVLGYSWQSARQNPERCLTYNDFQLQHHTEDAKGFGTPFAPFYPMTDASPSLYVGFDKPLPNDLVSLYLDIKETSDPAQSLVWEVWDGVQWSAVKVEDSTAGLRRPGMVSFLSPAVPPRRSAPVQSISGSQVLTGGVLEAAVFLPGDDVVLRKGKDQELAQVARVDGAAVVLEAPLASDYSGGTIESAALARFGTSRDWLRARMKDNGEPGFSRVNGLYLNGVWARQVETLTDEALGNGLGRLNQSMFFSHFPVLPGEIVEVRELEGARAEVEYPILREQLLSAGFTDADLETVRDPRTGKVKEVWVRWRGRPHLHFSGPDDRHYALERARGRIVFGNGRNGKLPTPGNSNIRARRYQSGGGLKGNLAKGEIKQPLSGAPAQSVFNPAPGVGGAESETLEGVMWRGPQVTRHRGRALSAADYEALAREASPGVALARALPATAPNLRPAPGWVTVIIVPLSAEPRPEPSYDFRQAIAEYLAARVPATVDAPRIGVISPTYQPVGVSAWVAPVDPGQTAQVKDGVLASLSRLFHPLTGGPDGRGWPFGRSVCVSDVAAVLEAVPGVDYVKRLQLLVDDVPNGDVVTVAPDRIVVAGTFSIQMIAEGS